jgi:hypothetical protein
MTTPELDHPSATTHPPTAARQNRPLTPKEYVTRNTEPQRESTYEFSSEISEPRPMLILNLVTLSEGVSSERTWTRALYVLFVRLSIKISTSIQIEVVFQIHPD